MCNGEARVREAAGDYREMSVQNVPRSKGVCRERGDSVYALTDACKDRNSKNRQVLTKLRVLIPFQIDFVREEAESLLYRV